MCFSDAVHKITFFQIEFFKMQVNSSLKLPLKCTLHILNAIMGCIFTSQMHFTQFQNYFLCFFKNENKIFSLFLQMLQSCTTDVFHMPVGHLLVVPKAAAHRAGHFEVCWGSVGAKLTELGHTILFLELFLQMLRSILPEKENKLFSQMRRSKFPQNVNKIDSSGGSTVDHLA